MSLESVLRSLLYAACVLSFLAQSFKEIEKFSSGLRSTAMSTKKERDLAYPKIGVCTREAYKTMESVTTRAKFISNTFSWDEVMANDNDTELPVRIEEVATFNDGRSATIAVISI